MRAFIIKTVAQRAEGKRPSPPRAAAIAVAASAAAAGITYRVLRG